MWGKPAYTSAYGAHGEKLLYHSHCFSSYQFPDVVSFCDSMAELGKIVIVAALDGTFQKQVL